MRPVLRVAMGAVPLMFAAGLSGCLSPHTNLLEAHQRIAVPLAENQTYDTEYNRGLEVEVTEAVRRTFIQDARLSLVSRDEADLLLEVRITKLERSPVRADRYGELAEGQILLTARLTLTNLRTGKSYFRDRAVRNDGERFESGLYSIRRGQNEEQGRARAVEDLGRSIARQVLDYW
jgi:hypothetical protein